MLADSRVVVKSPARAGYSCTPSPNMTQQMLIKEATSILCHTRSIFAREVDVFQLYIGLLVAPDVPRNTSCCLVKTRMLQDRVDRS